MTRILPWLIPSGAILAVFVFAIARSTSSASSPAVPPTGFGAPATDISQLSPDERVDRLFNRVMAAAEAGKTDTVAFFAPMAINSFQALAPLTPHRRFDLGLIHLAAGDSRSAKAEADTILAAAPNHLLGLVLAIRVAKATNDAAARTRLAARFKQRLASERARGLPEYTDHATEIDVTLAEIDAPTKM